MTRVSIVYFSWRFWISQQFSKQKNFKMLSSSYPMESFYQMADLLVGWHNTMVVRDDYISRQKLHQHSTQPIAEITHSIYFNVIYVWSAVFMHNKYFEQLHN